MIYEIFSTILALVFVIAVPISIISGIVCLFSNKTNALKILQYSGITSIVSLILIAGCIAYEQGIEEDNTIEQLQIENAELNKQIEAIKQKHKECEAHIKDLQTRYDNILTENVYWIEENNKLKEQLNSVEETKESDDEVVVTSEESKKAVNNNNSNHYTEKDDNTTNNPSNGKYVYWTSGGKSYHSRKNCRSLARSKNILEGTNCLKTDPCNNCCR